MQYQGVTDIESVKDCCCLNHHACCGVSRKNERYVTVWFEVTVFRKCVCVCEIIGADEKSMAPLKLRLWGVSGATSVYYLCLYCFLIIFLIYLFIYLFIYYLVYLFFLFYFFICIYLFFIYPYIIYTLPLYLYLLQDRYKCIRM